MKLMKTTLKEVDMVICLDSGAADTKTLWMTSSLRGIVNLDLKVAILKDPVHSGDAGGIVPETFRICRALLNRLEDAKSGKMIEALHVPIPESRVKEAAHLAEELGSKLYTCYPFVAHALPQDTNMAETLLNRCWRPTLAVTGADGLPSISNAGNVLRSSTTLRLSIRLPPTLQAKPTSEMIKQLLMKNPPYGADVTISNVSPSDGWNAKDFPPALHSALNKVSQVVPEPLSP
jgi:acetylornithine deacetylase/succinyl-diaminopimelate desuccinylase-like protein